MQQNVIEILEREYGGIGPALHFGSVYQLLVAVILSAQTNDNQVNKITEQLFVVCPTPEEMVKLTQSQLEVYIKTCGLYQNKAKNILAASKMLLLDFDGEVPSTREELLLLPGVGRKTANVVLSVGFGIPALAVDTHVFRVANRLGLSQGKTPDAVEQDLCLAIPREKWAAAHHWLIWHGRKKCMARKPNCGECPLTDYCKFYQENGGVINNEEKQ